MPEICQAVLPHLLLLLMLQVLQMYSDLKFCILKGKSRYTNFPYFSQARLLKDYILCSSYIRLSFYFCLILLALCYESCLRGIGGKAGMFTNTVYQNN